MNAGQFFLAGDEDYVLDLPLQKGFGILRLPLRRQGHLFEFVIGYRISSSTN
jgi:hypothetical protein